MMIDEIVNRLEEFGLEVESVAVQALSYIRSDSIKLDLESTNVYDLRMGGDLRLVYDEACEVFQLMVGNKLLRWNPMSSELALLDGGRSYRWMPLELFVENGCIVCLMETSDFMLCEFVDLLYLIKSMLTWK